MEKCQKVLDRFIEIAKNQENFSEDISLDEEIKSFKQLLKFFKNNDFINDADQRL